MKTKFKKPFIMIIYGPTGVGKTEVALSIAEHIPSEIINIDVGQFYEPLAIGTAKPDWKNCATPHHLFDIINTPRSISVTNYYQMLMPIIKEILARGNLPILVGGSSFYVHSLFFPLNVQKNNINILDLYPQGHDLWKELYSIDPERALRINRSDTYRIIRALEVWHTTGNKPSTLSPHYEPMADFLLVYAQRDLADLNSRINSRVLEMINTGWIKETELLLATEWPEFIKAKKLIGYDDILHFLAGEKDKKSFENMVRVIQNKTRQYAKRQRVFMKKMERDLSRPSTINNHFIGCQEFLNLTDLDIRLYINELLKRFSFVGKKYE